MKTASPFHRRLRWSPGLIAGAVLTLPNAALAQEAPEPVLDHPEWATAPKTAGAAITAYTAKKIYTMDPERREVQALSFRNGKALFTGILEQQPRHPIRNPCARSSA